MTYQRPKKIPHLFREGDTSYIRDPKNVANLAAGLPFSARGALSIFIDILSINDWVGVPADPPGFIAWQIGVSEGVWYKLRSTLLKAGRLKISIISGVRYYTLADPDYMPGGRYAVARPSTTPPQYSDGDPPPADQYPPMTKTERAADTTGPEPQDDEFKSYEGHDDLLVVPEPIKSVTFPVREYQIIPDAVITLENGDTVMADWIQPDDPARIEAKNNQPDPDLAEPLIPPAPVLADNIMPIPSAYELLERAGVDVKSHPKGKLFWHQTGHKDVIRRWLAVLPLSEIVVRIDKARIEGRLPAKANSLMAYESIVMEP